MIMNMLGQNENPLVDNDHDNGTGSPYGRTEARLLRLRGGSQARGVGNGFRRSFTLGTETEPF